MPTTNWSTADDSTSQDIHAWRGLICRNTIISLVTRENIPPSAWRAILMSDDDFPFWRKFVSRSLLPILQQQDIALSRTHGELSDPLKKRPEIRKVKGMPARCYPGHLALCPRSHTPPPSPTLHSPLGPSWCIIKTWHPSALTCPRLTMCPRERHKTREQSTFTS